MRKTILGIFAIIVMALATWSCGGGATSSPSSVAEEAIKCLQEKDYEGYSKLIYLKEKEGQTIEDQQKAIVALIADKMNKTLDKKDGIKSYEIVSEEIAEDGKSGKVKTIITYGNGDTDKQNLSVIKTDDGEWMIDAKK